MVNAREEFLEHVDGKASVLCAAIRTYGSARRGENEKIIHLPMDYTRQQYEAFLTKLEFEYDEGFGRRELFGTIWYEDGNWSDRGDYDGSEWWDYKSCPEIPPEVQ